MPKGEQPKLRMGSSGFPRRLVGLIRSPLGRNTAFSARPELRLPHLEGDQAVERLHERVKGRRCFTSLMSVIGGHQRPAERRWCTNRMMGAEWQL